MKLIYLWAEDIDGIIKDQEFNFGSKYRFHFNGEKLEVEEDKDYIEDFFENKKEGPVINITNIVGKNGAGKTTLINYITRIIGEKNIKSHEKCILVFESNKSNDEKEIFIFNNIEEEKKEVFEASINIGYETINDFSVIGKVETFYYTNTVSLNTPGKIDDENYNDISFVNKVKQYEDELGLYNYSGHNSSNFEKYESRSQLSKTLESYLNLERINEIELFFSNKFKEICSAIGFEITDRFEFTIDNHSFVNEEFTEKNLNILTNESHISTIIKKSFSNKLLHELLLHYIGEMIYYFENEVSKKSCYFEKEVCVSNKESNFDVINKYVDKSIEVFVREKTKLGFPKNAVEMDAGRYRAIIDFLLYRDITSIFNDEMDLKYDFMRRTFNFRMNEEKAKYIIELLKLDTNLPITKRRVYIKNSNSFSSGEKAILSLFSNFLIEDNQLLEKNIVIFLDEIELYLHPEWQRCIVSMLVKWCKSMFKECRSVQIIMTSNSPFILSDMPKSNVIALEKTRSKKSDTSDISNQFYSFDVDKSFGANIHDLLSNSFFLDYTIGEFSRHKIQEVVDIINDWKPKFGEDDERKKVKRLINNIGEPIIKNKLLQMYKEKCLSGEKDIELQLRKLQEEKEKITKLIEDNKLNDIDTILEMLNKKIEVMKEQLGENND